MERLQELLDRATREPLTDSELERLAEMAKEAGAVRPAVEALITGNEQALVNLRRAAELRRAYCDHMSRARTKSPPRGKRYAQRTSRFAFTSHAVDRYVERCGSGMTAMEAEARLMAEAGMASRMRRKTKNGHEQWKTPSGAVLVVKRDRPGRPGTCVTVLTELQALSGASP